jgi:L-alanine-DL-glutamate epimerase-like enolase superfamily enzyme
MKIADVRTFVVGNPPPQPGGPYWVFLKLTTDNGIAGYGEAFGVPFDPHVVARMIEDVAARFFVGEVVAERHPYDGPMFPEMVRDPI